MDLGLVAAALRLSNRRRRWILLLATAGLSGYAAYRAYHHPAVAQRRRKLLTLLRALSSLADATTSSAETAALVSSDLSLFLRSDSDTIPQSLKQLLKIASSDELSNALAKVSESLTVGFIRGLKAGSKLESEQSFADRLINKLLSAEGNGFASVVVGSFAKNLVLGFYSSGDWTIGDSSDSQASSKWIHLICRDECRALIADCVEKFVSTAVTVCLEKTMAVKGDDEASGGSTNPEQEAKVKDILVTVCNGAVETLVKTSHQVLSASNPCSSIDRMKDYEQEAGVLCKRDERNILSDKGKGNGGWVNRMPSTMTMPSNWQLVLDVTGRVTYETVRSVLEFLLWNLYNGARRSVKVVREEAGLDVVRYISAKSMVIIAMCLTLCMQMIVGTRFLMPA